MIRSYFNGNNGSEGLINFNLGFYFHIMLKENSFIRLDFGLIGGMGYKLKNELKSMSVGVLCYYGIVDFKKIQMP